MLGVDAALGLGIDADRLRSHQVAHHVEVVRGEIDDDADVADASRERSEPGGADLEDAPQLTGVQATVAARGWRG